MKRLVSILLAAMICAASAACSIPASAVAYRRFSDVEPDRWSVEAIKYAEERGYMLGTGDGKFSPERELTRAEAVTVLWRRAGSPEPSAPSPFTDVEAGAWYADACSWAAENRIVLGVTDTLFGPENTVTREQLAAVFFRYSAFCPVSVPERADLSAFSDAGSESAWAAEPLGWAVESGLLEGADGNLLDPKGPATREQFAAIIERFDGTFSLVYNEPVPVSHFTEREYPLVTDADYYVSPSGSDENDGTFEHPFATFAHAVEAVRAIPKTAERGGITVAFMAGTYAAPVDITLTSEDSGTAECPVTYCKYGDGDVIFNAGVTLPGEGFEDLDEDDLDMFPQKTRDRVKRIKITDYGITPEEITEDNSIFKGQERLEPARWPNKYDTGNDAFIDYYSSISEDELSMILLPATNRRICQYHNLGDMCMFGYYEYDWKASSGPVRYYDPATGFITPTVNGRIHRTQDHGACPYFFFYNIPDELDTEEEYYIDRNTGYFYIMDPEGDYTIARTGKMFTLTDADHISFVGLEFCFGSADFMRANDSDYITFDRCRFHNIRGWCIYIYGDHVTVRDCEFFDIGMRCIDMCSGDRETLTPGDSLIENCLFDHFGSVGKTGMAAIYVWGCGIRIAHNEICNSTNIGIFYSEYIWASNDITIEYNYLHDVVKQTSDSGAIYGGRNMAGHGTVIRYNLICNVGTPEEQHSSLGIYLDDCMSGQEIYGNIFYNMASHSVFMSCGRENRIHDNIMINPRKSQKTEILFGQNNYNWLESETDGFTKPTGWNENIMILELVPFRSEVWAKRFPLLSKLVYDVDAVLPIDDPDCPFNPSYNELYGNTIISTQYGIDAGKLVVIEEQPARFATRIDETPIYTTEENPFFVNPTLGDYRLIPGCGFDIPVGSIGRY